MINFYNISKVYKLETEEYSAIKNINITINRGEFVSITGPSGSGKSTIMEIACLINRPTFGKYLLDNIDVSLAEDEELHNLRNSKIGIVFKQPNLINEFNVLQNLELPLIYRDVQPQARSEKIMRMLSYFGVENYALKYPESVPRVKQQIIAIIRAIINDPELIIVDEPTGNLDSTMAEEILAIFQRLNASGKTIVYVTHDIDVARHAKRVICVKDGIIIKDVVLANPINSEEMLKKIKGNNHKF